MKRRASRRKCYRRESEEVQRRKLWRAWEVAAERLMKSGIARFEPCPPMAIAPAIWMPRPYVQLSQNDAPR